MVEHNNAIKMSGSTLYKRVSFGCRLNQMSLNNQPINISSPTHTLNVTIPACVGCVKIHI